MVRQPPKVRLKVWPPEILEKAEKLMSKGPMKEPFQLAPWAFVVDPVKFHENILADIKAGPHGPRAITGAILGDLDLYLACQLSLEKVIET